MKLKKDMSKCAGCPFADKSEYFIPDRFVKNSEILILAQNPGQHEEDGQKIIDKHWINGKLEEEVAEVRPQPLIGPTGYWIQHDFWPLTKLDVDFNQVSKANVIKCRPDGTNELPKIESKVLRQAIAHCTREYLRLPESTRFVLSLGGVSWYYLTGMKSLQDKYGSYRGYSVGVVNREHPTEEILGVTEYYDLHSVKDTLTVFPTLHPASLFKNPKMHHAVLSDFAKFGRLVKGFWPRPLPNIIRKQPDIFPKIFGFDTEYNPNNPDDLIMWSMADLEGNVYVVDAIDTTDMTILPGSIVVTQNGLVDMPHIRKFIPERIFKTLNMEDCMLLHSVLHTGEPHSLDFILSMYGLYNRHKHLSNNNPYLYAGLDADTTLNHAWRGMIKEAKVDRESWNVYATKRKPLIPIIDKNQTFGLKVDQEKVDIIVNIMTDRMYRLSQEAKLLTGNPNFKLSSHKQNSNFIFPEEIE